MIISRSGFYEYLNRKPSKRMLENDVLSAEIRTIFEEHKDRYGSKRISKALALCLVFLDTSKPAHYLRFNSSDALNTK